MRRTAAKKQKRRIKVRSIKVRSIKEKSSKTDCRGEVTERKKMES